MTTAPPPKLLFVVPCYNEQDVLLTTAKQLYDQIQVLNKMNLCSLNGSGILFVDDGSRDATWNLILHISTIYPVISGLSLSCNKGHMTALVAGLEAAVRKADVIITIDADLQDDIGVCKDMLSFCEQGYDIVYGVRSDRSTDTPTKKFFANSFYQLMLFMGVKIIPSHGDFRMMTQRAVKELLRYQERSLFLRGLIPQLGYKTIAVYYSRKKREAGRSKYPFRKSLSLAVDGMVSFSSKPLRLISYMGIILALGSFLGLVIILHGYMSGKMVPGWTSLMVVMMVIGGTQLIGLGIVGEYLGRTYKEVKGRPLYHIKDIIN